MPRKTEGRGAFVKFDLTDEAWAAFKASTQYYRLTRADLLRRFVDSWNQAFFDAIAAGEIDPSKTEAFEGEG